MDARLSRMSSDNNDCEKFGAWFFCHNPFPVREYVIFLSMGVAGNEVRNCHLADQIENLNIDRNIGDNCDKVKE